VKRYLLSTVASLSGRRQQEVIEAVVTNLAKDEPPVASDILVLHPASFISRALGIESGAILLISSTIC
jgi:hypothetical protein